MNWIGRAGVAIVVAMAGAQALNVVLVVQDPAGFANRLGLPLASPGDAAWVQIYALRTTFIALMLLALAAAKAWRALFLVSIAALVMPLGDAALTYAQGAPAATVLRHCAYVAVIAVGIACLSQTQKTARD